MCARSLQTLKILSFLFPAVFYIFIFISLYLIAAIPLSISFIPCSLVFPSLHPHFQSYLSLSTSGIQSNSSPCFILGKPPHLDVLSQFYSSIFLSIKSNLFSKHYQQNYFVKIVLLTSFFPFIHPVFLQSLHPSVHSFIHVSSLFHTKYFPASMSAGAFHYIHTHNHIQYVRTQTLKYRVSSDPNRRKGDGGSEIS